MKQHTVMSSRFSNTPRAEIQRSSFDRSHGYKTTFNGGLLIPFYADEALPGDTFNLKVTAFGRLATPIKPFLDNLWIETFFFSVPVRQVWDNWAKFNGEQSTPSSSIDFTVPTVDLTAAVAVESIYDYMGIPTDVFGTDGFTVNALHFRAYNRIYDEWFRDQNLQDSAVTRQDDGPDPETSYSIKRRRKRPDYFTSCLPWPQKGTAVAVPIAGTAPVVPTLNNTIPPSFEGPAGDAIGNMQSGGTTSTPPNQNTFSLNDGALPAQIKAHWATTGLETDLSQSTGITINDLRQSFQVQRILERDARSGTRYPEILKAHFGVTDPQMLVLQRPEFLGGGSAMINVNPVQQQGASDTTGGPTPITPQGNLAAYGTTTIRNHGFTKSFTEHCVLIGLVNVRADISYQQGLDRMWSRQTRFDYYWPALSHLGEQSVLNKEIYLQGIDIEDDGVFGYQERYAEYRFKNSLITGEFRSTHSASLDIWHLSQEFTTPPVLNSAFVQDSPPIGRVSAVTGEPHMLLDCYFHLRCARPMPLYGTPGMIDHF